MKISLIITVLNEASSLPMLLDTIAVQTRQPDEVIIGFAADENARPGFSGHEFEVSLIGHISKGLEMLPERIKSGRPACPPPPPSRAGLDARRLKKII